MMLKSSNLRSLTNVLNTRSIGVATPQKHTFTSETANTTHFNEIMDMTKKFLIPYNINSTVFQLDERVVEMWEPVIEHSLRYDYSIIMKDENGKSVAFRVSHPLKRGISVFGKSHEDPILNRYSSLVSHVLDHFWELPHSAGVDSVLCHHGYAVDPQYKGNRLGEKVLMSRIDIDRLKREGFSGEILEGNSVPTKLIAKYKAYQQIYTVPRRYYEQEKLPVPERINRISLMYAPFSASEIVDDS